MLHARDDYARIQDPTGRIPADEPVFLLRGQDPKIQHCIKFWIELAEKDGSDPRLIEVLRQHLTRCDDWQKRVKKKVQSDMPAEKPVYTDEEVRCGQVWESTDFRTKGQRVRINQFLTDGTVLCHIDVMAGGRPLPSASSRQIRIPMSRFRPHVKFGYKLVEDVQ